MSDSKSDDSKSDDSKSDDSKSDDSKILSKNNILIGFAIIGFLVFSYIIYEQFIEKSDDGSSKTPEGSNQEVGQTIDAQNNTRDNADICQDINCGIHGGCDDTEGGKCQCDDGWIGAACEKKDQCYRVYCRPGQFCDPDDGECTNY